MRHWYTSPCALSLPQATGLLISEPDVAVVPLVAGQVRGRRPGGFRCVGASGGHCGSNILVAFESGRPEECLSVWSACSRFL